jgi:hypothetical protein
VFVYQTDYGVRLMTYLFYPLIAVLSVLPLIFAAVGVISSNLDRVLSSRHRTGVVCPHL